jgi:DoxX-like family
MTEMHSPSGSYPLGHHQYRNEVPQHHHRDLPSSRAVCHSSVLSHQHGWGCGKSLRPKATLQQSLPWVEDYQPGTVKLIGITEFLGALGLILPWATGIAPVLTPLAATGLVIVQALAIRVHIRRKEQSSLPLNAALLLGAAFVAVTRFASL